jgi:hypothetical protein
MWILLLLLVAGCSEAHAVAPPKKEPRKMPLGEQLAQEAASRPERAIRPQQLIDALAQQGVTIVRHRQVLASPVEASYCETMSSEQGLALSLCEYPDQAAAERGRATSKRAFDELVPGRALDTRFNSLLTVTSERDRARARQIFAHLQPTTR